MPPSFLFMEYLLPYITLMSITLLAAMSPGPDMIVVIKNSILSRRLGTSQLWG